jgi:uncharacterized membrane protein
MFFHHAFGYGHGAWPGILMAVGMAIFWIAVIVLIVWLVREFAGRRATQATQATAVQPAPVAAATYHQAPPMVESPVQILERRYAAGEIDRDEFLRRREDLTPPAPPA